MIVTHDFALGSLVISSSLRASDSTWAYICELNAASCVRRGSPDLAAAFREGGQLRLSDASASSRVKFPLVTRDLAERWYPADVGRQWEEGFITNPGNEHSSCVTITAVADKLTDARDSNMSVPAQLAAAR